MFAFSIARAVRTNTTSYVADRNDAPATEHQFSRHIEMMGEVLVFSFSHEAEPVDCDEAAVSVVDASVVVDDATAAVAVTAPSVATLVAEAAVVVPPVMTENPPALAPLADPVACGTRSVVVLPLLTWTCCAQFV
jgi:hypothetical protein